ncbi:hypothetical protein ACLB1O_00795 [Escherichia coli]
MRWRRVCRWKRINSTLSTTVWRNAGPFAIARRSGIRRSVKPGRNDHGSGAAARCWPVGQMFPEPLFDGHFRLLQQRLVGERHLKVMVEPVGGGPLLDGIAFNVDTALWPDNGVREVQLAYKLDINEFRGNRSLQIIIDSIWPI